MIRSNVLAKTDYEMTNLIQEALRAQIFSLRSSKEIVTHMQSNQFKITQIYSHIKINLHLSYILGSIDTVSLN